MVCFNPMRPSLARERNPVTPQALARGETVGKRGLVFDSRKALIEGSLLTVPCGLCLGCRLDRSQAWGIRCHHEAQMHESAVFLTLTYRDEDLPDDNSVCVNVSQKFMQDLRNALRARGIKVRFLMCGEYGSKKGRAHYHVIVFGYSFPDRVLDRYTNRGDPLYRSAELDGIWPYGFASIGEVSYESARYTASYAMKQYRGEGAEEHYDRQHPFTGEFHRVSPEFATMSRMPGIGQSWLAKYKSDVYPDDFVLVGGRKLKPPRFYDQQLSDAELEPVKRKRKVRAAAMSAVERSKERRGCREKLRGYKMEFWLDRSGGMF
ncbi:MAG: putative replication initiation protein [Microviridae sp.]|nr:MAG: putative replication initiation protein [Microviridae sp.]